MTDRLRATFAFLPVGLDRLVRTALPGVRERSVVVPVAFGLLLLAAVPFFQAGFSLVTTRTIPSEVIDRQVGGLTMLEVVGQAYDTRLAAGTDEQGRPLRWLAVRDDATQRGMFMIRTPASSAALRTRHVTARVAVDARIVASVSDALGERGAAAAAADTLGGRYLVEAAGAADARDVRSADELASAAPGSVVRVQMQFEGVGIAACTIDASCDARRVAGGDAIWLQRATVAGSDVRLLVSTPYPPSAMPVDLVGRQVLDQPAVQALAATPAAERLLGWGRMFDIAILDHDPELPVDRSWLAIGVLALSGLALLVARRRPYPAFRHEARPAGWSVARDGADARATGRVTLPDAPPQQVLDAPARIEQAGAGRPAAVTLDLPDGPQRLEVPQAATGVRGLEIGRLAWVRASRPALWLHWYQTELQLAFENRDDRDRAATLLAGVTAPPPPPAAPPPPPPPPRRPATPVADEDAPPEWRRPRPRGAR